jgi:hypothetical protein
MMAATARLLPLRQAATAAALALALSGCAHGGASAPGRHEAPGTNQDTAAFLARVHEYMALHTAAKQSLPPLPPDPTAEQVDTRQRAFAKLIGQERAKARPGDVFTPGVRAYFRTRLLRALSGPDGAELRGSIMDENPGRIQLRINGRYPDTVPLSTMPYQILAVLPPLPEELEYRFLGARLVLLDAHAHIVIDYMDDALPK